MKRISKGIAAVLLLALACPVFALDAEPKVGDLDRSYSIPYCYLNGFEFSGYVPSAIGLEDLVEADVEYIKTRDAATVNSFAVIGHSQGGLRSLAYASYLKKNDPAEYNRLKAVITMSGIDRGLKALEGGVGAFKAKVWTDVFTLYDGVAGTIDVLLPGSATILKVIGGFTASSSYIKGALEDMIVECFPEEQQAYLYPALGSNTNLDQMGEIRDMIPRSAFIKEYVTDSTSYTYKVQTGTTKVWYWAKGWLGIPYLTYRNDPVYKYYSSSFDKPKIPAGMPTGYLVGLNSNTLGMLDEETGGTVSEESIRDTCGTMEVVFNIAGGIHAALWVATLTLCNYQETLMNDCFDAADWVGDIDGQLNELKGSSQNDGLVAKESQFIARTHYRMDTKTTVNVHPNVIGSKAEGYREFKHLNHATIRTANDIEVEKEIKLMLSQASNQKTNN